MNYHSSSLCGIWAAPFSTNLQSLSNAPLPRPISVDTRSTRIAWNRNDTLLAAARPDYVIMTYRVSSSKLDPHLKLRGHTSKINDVVWHPQNEDLCISASADGTVRIWDLRARTCVAQIDNQGRDNLNIAWSPDALQLAVGTRNDHLGSMDLRQRKLIHSTRLSRQVNQLSFISNDELLVATGQHGLPGRGFTERWTCNESELSLIEKIQLHTATQTSICSSVDKSILLTTGADSLVNVLDASSMSVVQTLDRIDEAIWPIDIAFDGSCAVVASKLGADLYRTSDGSKLRSLPYDGVHAVSFARTSLALAICHEGSDRQHLGPVISMLVPDPVVAV